MNLTKNEFLKPCELLGPFSVPNLGVIYIRQVNLPEAISLHRKGDGNEAVVLANLIIAAVCDGDGNAVFNQEDEAALMSATASNMQPLALLVDQHVALGVVDVDEIEGNSEAITQSSSGTA